LYCTVGVHSGSELGLEDVVPEGILIFVVVIHVHGRTVFFLLLLHLLVFFAVLRFSRLARRAVRCTRLVRGGLGKSSVHCVPNVVLIDIRHRQIFARPGWLGGRRVVVMNSFHGRGVVRARRRVLA
jgi:hypothetical protein